MSLEPLRDGWIHFSNQHSDLSIKIIADITHRISRALSLSGTNTEYAESELTHLFSKANSSKSIILYVCKFILAKHSHNNGNHNGDFREYTTRYTRTNTDTMVNREEEQQRQQQQQVSNNNNYVFVQFMLKYLQNWNTINALRLYMCWTAKLEMNVCARIAIDLPSTYQLSSLCVCLCFCILCACLFSLWPYDW